MYHLLIRRKVRGIFADLNRCEYEATLGNMATHSEHRFSDDRHIGGSRPSLPGFRLWFERLMPRTNGRLEVELHHVPVAGWP